MQSWFLISGWALLSAIKAINMYADVWRTLPAQRRPTHFCWKETPNCFCVNMPAPLSQPEGSPAEEALRSLEDEWHGSEKKKKAKTWQEFCDDPVITGFTQNWLCLKARSLRDCGATLVYYLHVSPVCHPSCQLLSCKTSDLQFVGISSARFPFGREMEEGRSRVHVELQTK